MVGIDIVKIERIKLSKRFISLVLSPREIELLNLKDKKKEFLAARFAAKEAFLKANKKGLFEMSLNEIEVLSDDNGAPYILYHNQRYDNVSIAHEVEYATAVVII
ncbi:Holo-[acyl-carrier-protein] synthase [bioreactor metagenome]|uniref:Holo-[acyl-carrier-protein] synthase n=1 Tax=bioreactor metagenome TaxID=1076179 RepID=A0A645GAX0_9ZZZZ